MRLSYLALILLLASAFLFSTGCQPDEEMRIESLSPTPARQGKALDIYGAGFGDHAPGENMAFVSNSCSTVLYWSDSHVSIRVPTGIGIGAKVLELRTDSGSVQYDFEIVGPDLPWTPSEGCDNTVIPDVEEDDGYELDEIIEECDEDYCNGNGECRGSAGNFYCVCVEPYEGARCDSCALGYYMDSTGSCQLIEEYCDSSYCGYKGDCYIDPSLGEQCSCYHPYSGSYCESCRDGYVLNEWGECLPDGEHCEPGTCNYNGDCYYDEAIGEYCSCYYPYEGSSCDGCVDGYYMTDWGECTPIEEYCDAYVCNYNGDCYFDPYFGEYCYCYYPYDGMYCDSCASGYLMSEWGECIPDGEYCDDSVCNYNGECYFDPYYGEYCYCNYPYEGKLSQ